LQLTRRELAALHAPFDVATRGQSSLVVITLAATVGSV
jgi:hypothetical protein